MKDFRLETERLVLLPVSPEYRGEMFEEYSPTVTRYMTHPTPPDISGTDAFIAASRANMEEGKEIVCCITLKETGEYLGNCGLHDIQTPTPRLGIWIKVSAHGHRFGREAVTALKEWADEHLKCEYLAYDVAKENWPSRKIAESLGGTVAKEEVKQYGGKPTPSLEYRILPKR